MPGQQYGNTSGGLDLVATLSLLLRLASCQCSWDELELPTKGQVVLSTLNALGAASREGGTQRDSKLRSQAAGRISVAVVTAWPPAPE